MNKEMRREDGDDEMQHEAAEVCAHLKTERIQ